MQPKSPACSCDAGDSIRKSAELGSLVGENRTVAQLYKQIAVLTVLRCTSLNKQGIRDSNPLTTKSKGKGAVPQSPDHNVPIAVSPAEACANALRSAGKAAPPEHRCTNSNLSGDPSNQGNLTRQSIIYQVRARG
ncbi:hypothetical protein [Scytonema sp. HK-05]|uniref:hypothetical protein n=1 Tax=Scytonema sp. HK-05 TaxID=1137095 RepID=UPI00093772B5|nr:hypothetical protein [Scytonema sp. HK-05]OKH60568.1 hypothetical protein NIES2130_02290 [Scytonema sp. HK-05]